MTFARAREFSPEAFFGPKRSKYASSDFSGYATVNGKPYE